MTDAVTLHTVVDGPPDAPVLLVGESLGTNTGMWQPQVAALARHFRVVRFDHRGHGGSPVPAGPYTLDDLGGDLLGLLDDLGAERVAYAGLSLGGMVGMWLASHAPDRVSRLALVCTSALLGPAQGWHDRAAAVRAGSTGSVADAVVARWFTPGFAERRPEVVAAHKAMLAATDDEGYASCCEAIATMDLTSHLGAITAPTLVLAGADDLATPPVHAETIVAGVPDGRLEVVADAAHLANVEQPETVTRLLVEHLTS